MSNIENNVHPVTREFEDVETNLLFNIMRIAEILMSDICRRFEAKGARFNQKRKQEYNKYIYIIQEALKHFDRAIEDDYWVGANGEPFKYDKMRFEANELTRLLLIYIDRVATNPQNQPMIFQYILSLRSCGIVTDENLGWFDKINLRLSK